MKRRFRDYIFERCPEYLVTRPWMKLAYVDHARRELVMVAWPLCYLVEFAWIVNLVWCRYRLRESWIDREVKKRTERMK